MANILITGASGLVGKKLTELLLHQNHRVSHLVRSPEKGTVPSFKWDIKKKYIDPKALEGIDTIIHLAGAGVADRRWNEEWKNEILESRTLSSRLLYETLKNTRHAVKSFISASAIGIYGFTLSDQLFTEESASGNDFLAQVVRAWEHEVDQIAQLNIRVAKIRIGVVLAKQGGALAQMALPVKWYVGSPLASGRQYISWIHIDDLCGIFMKAVEDQQLHGAYNGVAPHPVTNAELTKEIANALHKPLWAPNVPGFVLKLVVGEMAGIVINGSNVSAKKVERAGYEFKFKSIGSALNDLL
jgi:uncharacterized protein (TIGR01777 family)